MRSPIHNPSLLSRLPPWYVYYPLLAVGRTVDFLDAHVNRRNLTRLTGGLVVGLLAWWALPAGANCDLIPDRVEDLCLNHLGYDYSPCPIIWETNEDGSYKSAFGELEITSDTDVDEPLTGSEERLTATVLQFTNPRIRVSKIFGVTAPNYHPDFYKPGDTPPCATPRCTIQQDVRGLEYRGVDEFELLDVLNVMARIPWNAPDVRIADKFRGTYDATGVPVVVWVWNPRLEDETSTELASMLRLRALILFALRNPEAVS